MKSLVYWFVRLGSELRQVVGVILAALLLSSCNHLEKGKVVKKIYEPSNTYPIFIPMRIGRVTTLIPMIMHDDEDFILEISGIHNSDTLNERVYVTKNCYNNLSVGDSWVKTQDCSFTDDNNTKTEK